MCSVPYTQLLYNLNIDPFLLVGLTIFAILMEMIRIALAWTSEVFKDEAEIELKTNLFFEIKKML